MIITDYSFIMAVISNIILILLLYILRKTKFCLSFLNIHTMVILYLVCLVRLMIPIEIPRLHFVLDDFTFYPLIKDTLTYKINATDSFAITPIMILLAIWFGVALVLFIRLFVKYNKTAKHFLALDNHNEYIDYDMLNKVKAECKITQDIGIICSEQISSPMCFGFFKKYIMLPAQSYSDTQLYHILKHELCHIKNKDIWVKLLTEIYCILFWWNPVAYLLKADLANCLEMKCDYTALSSSDNNERVDYYETVLYSLKSTMLSKSDRVKATNKLISCEFSRGEKKALLERFNSILKAKKTSIAVNIVACVVMLSVLLTSYAFIWQPAYHPTDEDIIGDDTNVVIVDSSNGYVLHKKDGSYVMCFGGEEYPAETDDVLSGMYRDYNIIEEE